MEVDEIQRQVCKFQRVSSNGSTTTTDNSSIPQKLATDRANLELQNYVDGGGGGGGGVGIDLVGCGGGSGSGGVGRLCGWPSSRIVRVSRASGGKDRHSKVLTSKGLRDRRVRLSVSTAIQFYDLQDRLGYDQPSKAVEWLLKAASTSIDELPSLDPPFTGASSDHHHQISSEMKLTVNGNELADRTYQQQNSTNVTQAKSPACSSTSETSKGSGLSLSRSENRIKARERARELASKREKEKEIDSTRVTALNPVNSMSDNSSFTDLLTGGINTATANCRSPMPDYFFTRPTQPSPQIIQLPQFNINIGDNQQHNHHPQFSFLDSFVPATTAGGGNESYNLNFAVMSSTTGGFSRGTLQSNLTSPSSTLLPHPHHHHHLQRFQSSSIDGPNLPFFIVPNTSVDHYSPTGAYHLNYGGGGDAGGRPSDHHKGKAKN